MNRKQIIVLCVGILVFIGSYVATENVDFRIPELIALAGRIAIITVTGYLVYTLRDKMDINPLETISGMLLYFASMKIQDKYMTHATKDSYLAPGDLFESGFHTIESVENRYRWTASLRRSERQAVIEFGKVLTKERDLLDLNKVTLEEIVSNNEPWANIREAAQKCLAALGFDLDALEKEEELS